MTPIAVQAEYSSIVYRVGYRPDPFAWTPWQYATDGRFEGRWDDHDGRFRTLYVADRLLGCLLDDRLRMWAIFEQPGEDETGSGRLTDQLPINLTSDTPELLEAFDVFGLSWS